MSATEATSPIVNCAEYCNGVRVGTPDLQDIGQVLMQSDRFVWVGLHEPDTDTLKKIQAQFQLHDLAIEDAHRAHQRPKMETYGDTLFIVLRTAQIVNRHIDMGETHIFLGRNFIVTIRHGSTLAYTDVRARCESTPHLLKSGPGFALYAIMDAITDRYFPVLEVLEEELDSLEDQIFTDSFSRDTAPKIYRLKRQLLDVKRAVSPLLDICNRLMRFDLTVFGEETRLYFRDVYDHAVRINEMIDNSRELLSAALEANFSLISINQNDVSKRFAGWAAIIGIPTMVAGIYGMNFKFMPELEWRYGYPLVMTITASFCVGLYLLFRRSGWL